MQNNSSELTQLADVVLQEAKAQGASQAAVSLSSTTGFDVTVRLGEVETVEHNRDKGLGVTVFFGQRKGSASTSDTSPEALKATVQAACDIAKVTGEDPCAGLAEPELMATDYPDLDLDHRWGIHPDRGIEIATECEDKARAMDKRIVNSDGANVATHQSCYVYANSHGFSGHVETSRHSLSCTLVAEDHQGMQRDYDFTVARDPHDLDSVAKVASRAALRTIQRLDARSIKTQQAPVIYSAEIAGGLLGSFIRAVSGSSLYQKASFLLDHLGKRVFPDFVQIHEDPHLPKALGSAPFDGEGVALQRSDLIVNGELCRYVLGSYSARKLGLKTTGNAGGVRNLRIASGPLDLTGLLKQMDTGLLVTELMGQGINLVTGDYSRGATGFWVEKGEIVYPVEEITIAGNLKDMFAHLAAVGNDVDYRGNICSGSLLIDNMTIAGAS